jgi:hypothetical protein
MAPTPGRWRGRSAATVAATAIALGVVGVVLSAPGVSAPGPSASLRASTATPTVARPSSGSIPPAPMASPPTPVGSPAPSASPGQAAAPPGAPSIDVAVERPVGPRPRSVSDRAWEPVLATHPTDPDRLAVVYLHRGRGAACSIAPVIRISHDGGRSWRQTASTPGAVTRRGMGLHAALAWGPGPGGRARLYWANMTTPGCGDPRFSLTTSFSDDEGRTWSRPRVERGTPPWVGGFPEIAVDRDPASPNHGVVYVAYNWVGRGGGPGFRLLASRDFGLTWRRAEIPPARLVAGTRVWWRIAYRLRPAADGSVYASWYQVDMRRRDPKNIFAKGGPGNVGRLGVAIARVGFDRTSGTLTLGPSRIAVTVRETAWTTASAAAPGTGGYIRPDPMWQYGFDVDRDGRLFVAVGGYGPNQASAARGTIRVARSMDRGRTWSAVTLPAAPAVAGRRQSSLRPNLVATDGLIVVTMRTLDDRSVGATMGTAFAASTDGGRTWAAPRAGSPVRWRATNLAGVTNGFGLRDRAERTADGDVVWVFGDGRFALGRQAGRTAILALRFDLVR